MTGAAQRARAWWREHPIAFDTALAVVLTVISLPTLWFAPSYISIDYRDPDALGVTLTIACCLPLVWRRRYPLIVFAVVGGASLALSLLLYSESFAGLASVIALYTVAANCERAVGIWCLLATLGATAVLFLLIDIPFTGVDLLASLAVYFGAWAFGRGIQVSRAYVAELELRASRNTQAQEADTRAALAEERGRIARELHDVVAHHVSVMTVQASAAQRTLDRDPERSREAMAAVEATGRAALVEMRRIVGVLRAGAEVLPGDLGPQPGVAELVDLVDQLREAGLDVALRIEGDRRTLSAGVDLTVYRIVQEALTNALKHAGPTRAWVTLEYRTAELVVRVNDSGGMSGGVRDDTPLRPGHGLIGMRERVALYGGRLDIGPGARGGFEVSASIPFDQVPA
jgi:signal transduction histidine kinase